MEMNKKNIINIVGAIGVLVTCFVIYWMLYGYESFKCHTKFESYSSSYGIFKGCQIEWNGKQTPIKLIRFNDVTL